MKKGKFIMSKMGTHQMYTELPPKLLIETVRVQKKNDDRIQNSLLSH